MENKKYFVLHEPDEQGSDCVSFIANSYQDCRKQFEEKFGKGSWENRVIDFHTEELKLPFEATNEKKYIGCKIIKAEPMTNFEFMESRGKPGDNIGVPDTSKGYKVTYPDGYISWSPKEVFENAYREITEGELKLING